MAEKSTKKTGTATANETWSDTLKPKTANSDICTVTGGFTLTWNSTEIIEAMTTEAGTTLAGSIAMSVGNANTPPSGFVLNLASGTASTFTGGFTLKASTAGALKVSIADTITTGLFTVETGKYELSRNTAVATLAGAATFRLKGSSSLDAKGHNLETNYLQVLETSSLTGLAGSTITITAGSAGEGLHVEPSATLEGEPTVVFANIEPAGTGRQFNGGGKKYGVLTVAAFVALEASNSFGTLNVNKVKPGECKATLTAASNHLVVTSGEAALFAGAEVAGTAIPVGTTVVKKIEAGVWELSANATETVAVAETVTIYNPGVIVTQATTQTVTTLASNGTSGEPARMASSVAGKPWTLALPAGNHELTAVLRIKDLSVPEGAVLYVPNSTNLGGNNANVRFEAEPAAGATEAFRQAAAATNTFTGRKIAGVPVAQTAAGTQALAARKLATGTLTQQSATTASTAATKRSSGALAQQAASVQRVGAQKVAHTAFQQQAAGTQATAGRKIALAQLVQTAATVSQTAAKKIAQGALNQAAAAQNLLAGLTRRAGAFLSRGAATNIFQGRETTPTETGTVRLSDHAASVALTDRATSVLLSDRATTVELSDGPSR